MTTILRKNGFRVVIYFYDHLPARVHVINADSEVKSNSIGTLTLTYNKARQAVITQEILEVCGGAEALNG